MDKAQVGQKKIKTEDWNAIRQFLNEYSQGKSGMVNSPQNPFLIDVKNNGSSDLPAFHVVRINTAMYANNTDSELKDAALNRPIELMTSSPQGKPDENIAVIQEDIPQGNIGKAICNGATLVRVLINDANKDYKFAKTISNTTEKLVADEKEGQARIIWKQPGQGTKLAYVILDQSGNEEAKITPYLNSSGDEYPDGASRLDSLDTYLYCSSLDKINKKGDNNPPYVYNPLGFPTDRPTVLARVEGFPGDAQEPSSGNRHIGELVAISNDVRDYFIVNSSGYNWSGMNSDTNENGSPGDYYAKGNLYYIQEPNNAYGHYLPVENPTAGLGGMRLAVCQRDMPEDWWNQFRMPYYTLEMNYGCKPNVSTATGESFTERCGVAPGDNKLSNKRLDYHFSNGRYTYEPIFTFRGHAKGTVGSSQVYIEIEGNDYYVYPYFDGGSSNGLLVPWGCYKPDIYPGDDIVVQVDAREFGNPAIRLIQCPMDYPENAEIIANSYAINVQRGWTDVTSEYTNQLGNNGVLVLGTGVAGINAHYSGDSTGAQIPQLYFIELGFRIYRKNKTNAII